MAAPDYSLWMRMRYPVWIIEGVDARRPVYRMMVCGKAVRMPRWVFRYVL